MHDTAPKKAGPIRRLYDWTISWADRPHGTWALFLIAFAESSFFPIPPDVLLVALCFGAREKWARYALVCTVGSILGAVAGWLIGWGLWSSVHDWFIPHLFSQAQFDKVGAMYAENAFLAVFTAAFTPIPYKVFTVAAGAFHVGIPVLVFGSIVGRGARFFIIAGLIRIFGPKVRPFVEKNIEWCFLAAGVLLVAAILAIKLLRH